MIRHLLFVFILLACTAASSQEPAPSTFLQVRQKKIFGSFIKSVKDKVVSGVKSLFGSKKSDPAEPPSQKKTVPGLEADINGLINRHEMDELKLNDEYTAKKAKLDERFQEQYMKWNADLQELKGLSPPSAQSAQVVGKASMPQMFGPPPLPAFSG